MKYCIKHNLPDGIITAKKISGYRMESAAIRKFLQIEKKLRTKNYSIKLHLRNTHDMPVRGTIRCEIDGFFYYVELYKTEG